MNILHFSGRLASAPVLTTPRGTTVVRFKLIRNEYAGTEEGGERRADRVVAIDFAAFGKRGEAIAKHAAQGDALHLTARLENNNYEKNGEDVYGFNFVVLDFEFGAPGKQKREWLDQQHAERGND